MKLSDILSMGFTLDVLKSIWEFSQINTKEMTINISSHDTNVTLEITGKNEKNIIGIKHVVLFPLSMVDTSDSSILHGWLDFVAHLWKGIYDSESSFLAFVSDKERDQQHYELMCLNYNQGKAILA